MQKQKEQQDPTFSQSFKWNRRHIIVDHFNKVILIQVMWDATGELATLQYQQIKNGNWAQFLPQGMSKGDIEVRNNLKALFGSGYQVRPMFFQGIENEEHAVLLLTDIREPKMTQIIT